MYVHGVEEAGRGRERLWSVGLRHGLDGSDQLDWDMAWTALEYDDPGFRSTLSLTRKRLTLITLGSFFNERMISLCTALDESKSMRNCEPWKCFSPALVMILGSGRHPSDAIWRTTPLLLITNFPIVEASALASA